MIGRALSLLILLAALIGVAGQGVAWGAIPPVSAEMSSATMPDDCAEMMQPAAPAKKMPCGGTADCMMAMGCMLPFLGSDQPPASLLPPSDRAQAFWPSMTFLTGREVGPEPDPPTSVG